MKKTATMIAISVLVAGVANAGDWARPAKNRVPLSPPSMDGSCLSYDYLDLEYGNNDYGNGFFHNGESFGGGFSKSIGSTFFLNGSFADSSYDYDWVGHIVGVDTRRYRLGLGAHREIAKCVDLTFEGGADYLEAEYGSGYTDHDYDSWSYYAGPGIRARAGRFEMFAKVFYVTSEGDATREYLAHHNCTCTDVSLSDDRWVFNPGFIFHVSDTFGVKVAAELDEHDTTFTFGGRLHF